MAKVSHAKVKRKAVVEKARSSHAKSLNRIVRNYQGSCLERTSCNVQTILELQKNKTGFVSLTSILQLRCELGAVPSLNLLKVGSR